MIPATGQTVKLTQVDTIEAWANIVVQIWEDKVQQLGINDTQALLNSFAIHVQRAAEGRVDYVMFAFQYYGRFVDMGVGKYQPHGAGLLNQINGAKDTSRRRAPRQWYSKTFYSQLRKLSDILAKKYAHQAALTVLTSSV